MSTLLGILAFFLILGILVIAHELGHFTFAKLFGVRVEEFGVGFPPRVRGWRRNGTLYSVNALPLGGFVRMAGENGDSTDPASFGAQPAWQRFVILVAGPTVNLLIALAIFFFSFMHGVPTVKDTTTVSQVVGHTPAAASGLRTGDRIVGVAGVKVRSAEQLHSVIARDLGQVVSVRVRRGGRFVTLHVLARRHPPPQQGAFGITIGTQVTQHYSPLQSVRHSVGTVGTMVAGVPQAIGQVVSPSGGGQVMGPVGIAHVTTETVKQEPQNGPQSLLLLMALLSANLGVLNLLPFPALDGGRIVFVLLSALRRRAVDPRLEGAIHATGMAFLLLLIVFLSYHDIARWVTGSQ